MGKRASTASPKQPADVPGSTTRKRLKDAGRTALAKGKSAGQRVVGVTLSAGKKAAVFVGDRNKDGVVDQEDAKVAATGTRKIASKVAEGAGKLAKAAAKHDMVKDAAAGAAIGAAVGIPVPIVGPAAGAAIGAIVGVTKNMRSTGKPPSGATGKPSKPSKVKAAIGRIRKPRPGAAAKPAAKLPKT